MSSAPRRIVRPARQVHAKYDAAQVTPENRRHLANVDGLSANAAMDPETRRRLRNWARYEVANNGYARGMVTTLANYVVGNGPRLQMLSDNDEFNRFVEAEYMTWAHATKLARKLWIMRVGQAMSGETFGVTVTNRGIDSPVQLDLRLVEADQVATPTMALSMRQPGLVDGIRIDKDGNPKSYFVMKRHPGDTSLAGLNAFDFDEINARFVFHMFCAERPGQNRGVPEITSSLSLYAMMRRYTMATILAAENAANAAGVVYTDASADSDAADVEPLDEVEMDRNTWLTMPYGWKIGQIKSEQPTTVYPDFKHEIVNESARPMNMPFNIAAGNSSGYNYASGRLDHQAFFKAIEIDQNRIAETVPDPLFAMWLFEAMRIDGYLPLSASKVSSNHKWFWDGHEHVDPAKEANAQKTRLGSRTTTLAREYAKQGLDWETELRQGAREDELRMELELSRQAKERELRKKLGLPEVTEDEEDVDENAEARSLAIAC